MKTNIRISKCECCGSSFSGGDSVFASLNLVNRQRYAYNLYCGICEPRMTKSDYIFSNGEALLILYGLPQCNLWSGSYVLEETYGKLTVHERRNPVVFGQEMLLEYRPHHQYLLLLPEDLRMPHSKLVNIVMHEKVYSALKTEAEYIIIDSSWNICGFTSTDTMFSEWCKKEKMTGSGLRCISVTELAAHYDTSDFRRECRCAIERGESAALIAH